MSFFGGRPSKLKIELQMTPECTIKHIIFQNFSLNGRPLGPVSLFEAGQAQQKFAPPLRNPGYAPQLCCVSVLWSMWFSS